MSFRSVLNAAYAALAFNKDDDELKALDFELERDPFSSHRPGPSKGMAQLMQAMKLPQMSAPPRPKAQTA